MHGFLNQLTSDATLAFGILTLAGATAFIILFIGQKFGVNFLASIFPVGGKLASLQGLRGLLALSVAAHHAYCWYFFTQFGYWTTGHSIVFAKLANFGVLQFFYISGFLFWKKLMGPSGLQRKTFYLSRFVRIAPVYYFCIALAILTGVLSAGIVLRVTLPELTRSLLPWLLFAIGGQPFVNGADIKRIVSGVVWTLALEWFFYFTLPFLSWFAKKRWRLFPVAGIFLIVFFICKQSPTSTGSLAAWSEFIRTFSRFMLIGFGGGMLVATFERETGNYIRCGSPLTRNVLLLAFYVGYLLAPGNVPLTDILLLAGFTLVVHGSDLFGLLTSKPGLLLGLVSYDLYLIHGWVYFVAMKLRGGIHLVPIGSYLLQTGVCIAVIVLLASLLHWLIERPSIEASEKINRRSKDSRPNLNVFDSESLQLPAMRP